MTRRRYIAPVLALLTVVLAGCGQLMDLPQELTPQEREQAEAELAARPRLEVMIARYEEMQTQIRDRLDAAIGPFAWEVVREGRLGGCGDNFPDMGGRTYSLPPWGFDAGISDTDWPVAKQIITDTAAEYGFETLTLQIDEPGRHQTSGADLELGAQYEVLTEVNTIMQFSTGCHLPDGPPSP